MHTIVVHKWVILQTEELKLWFKGLDENAKEDILAAVLVLETFGPSLGRPHVPDG